MNHGSSAPRSEFAVRLKFRPVDSSFYDLFSEAANHLVVGSQLLNEMLSAGSSKSEVAQRMREAEHAADETTHSIIRRVNSTFVTPFDREDIYELATTIDDVVDHIEEASDLLELYGIESMTKQALEQCRILVAAVEHLATGLADLKGRKGLQQELIDLKRLEDEGDRVVRDAIADLFRDSRIDPLIVIRWKDIFEALEAALDSCETAANVLGNILVKNA